MRTLLEIDQSQSLFLNKLHVVLFHRYYLEPKAVSARVIKEKAEEKRTAAKVAAEQKKKMAEEKRLTAIEIRKRKAEEQRAAAKMKLEDKKRAMEEKRSAAQAAAEEKRQLVGEQRVATKASIEAKKRAASQAVERAKPGSTISLGFFGFGQSDNTNEDNAASKVAAKRVSSAPRGVPTISKWRRNRDGSISGQIFGSSGFGEGESITTSPITSDPVDGSVVQTASGSR